MSAFVHWLAGEPVRWLVPLTLLSAVVGVPLMLWWERRRARRPRVRGSWRALPAEVQAARDEAVLDASEAAAQIIDAYAARVADLYCE
jgi:hypothetical protein